MIIRVIQVFLLGFGYDLLCYHTLPDLPPSNGNLAFIILLLFYKQCKNNQPYTFCALLK